MEMRKCDVCGEMYSTTYRTCPFCEEEEAMRKGKPMHRHASDFRNKRGGHALGVLALVLALVLIGGGGWMLFGDSIASRLGVRETSGTHDDVSTDGENQDGTTTLQCTVQVTGGETTGGETTTGTLTLNREDFTMGVGEKWQLKVSGTSSAVTWSIENSAIATIASDGTVTGVSKGITTAYAKVDGQTLECIVRIK